jgi:flagellar basal body L-ring protein FlgH
MRASTSALRIPLSSLHLLVVVIALAACSTTKEVHKAEAFKPETQFSQKIARPSKIVCWSVKRAFLSQGYMLDQAADSPTLTGVKNYQKDDETTVTLRLQTSCAENNDGTSTVFATASRDISKVQEEKQHRSGGIGWFTLTVPAGSRETLQIVKRETVQDPEFYQRFYALVKTFAEEDARNAARGAANR